MATVGTGKYTYELVDDWAKLPAGWTLGQTGIVTDSRDRVYLFNRSAHPLIVLDRDGTFFTSWGEGVLSSAHGMFIDQHEHIYLPVINSHVVLKYSPAGNLLMTLGTWNQPSETGWSGNYRDPVKQAAGPFHRPSDVAILPLGEIYISDGYGNARVGDPRNAGRIGVGPVCYGANFNHEFSPSAEDQPTWDSGPKAASFSTSFAIMPRPVSGKLPCKRDSPRVACIG